MTGKETPLDEAEAGDEMPPLPRSAVLSPSRRGEPGESAVEWRNGTGTAPTRGSRARLRAAERAAGLTVPAQAPFRISRVFTLPPHLMRMARAACGIVAQGARARRRIRVWVPACKTGSTAYTISMLLLEEAPPLKPPDLMVYATDIDESALALARAGRYPARAALDMDPGLRARYTFDEGEIIRVAESLREKCVFGRHDLDRDRPLPRLDLIVCQHVFHGVAPAQRAELALRLHMALRQDGLLLALDHPEWFPLDLFEPVGGGCFRPRSQPSSAPPTSTSPERSLQELLADRRERLDIARAALVPWPRVTSEAQAGVGDFIRTLGHPLVVCDDELQVLMASAEALRLFAVCDDDRALELPALADRLSGGFDVVSAARRVLAGGAGEDVVVRRGAQTFLALVRSAHGGQRISVAFTDVTPFQAAATRASRQEARQAALAHLRERSLKLTDPNRLHEDGFEVLSLNLPGCTGAVVLEGASQPLELEVRASWGLGGEPDGRGVGSRLYDIAGLPRLLEDAFTLDRAVSRDLALSSDPASRGALVWPSPSSASTAAPATERVTACPLRGDGEVLGVVVVFRRSGSHDSEDEEFVRAVTAAMGEGILRCRVHRRLVLELDASRVATRAMTLAEAGAGWLRALRRFEVEALEIGEAQPAAPARWVPLYTSVGERVRQRAVAAVPSARSWGLTFRIAEDGCGEAWLPIHYSEPRSHLLRLWGKKLRTPDPEFARGLQRLAELVGEFLERLCLAHPVRLELTDRQERAELEALYVSLPLVVSFHDHAGVLRRINRELGADDETTALAGAGGDPAQKRERASLRCLYREQMPRWIERALETGQPLCDIELLVTEGGEHRFWLCSFVPVRGETGVLLGISAVAHDITALKLTALAPAPGAPA